jgi:hypothetical protein
MEGGADSAHAGRGWFFHFIFIFRRHTQVKGFHHLAGHGLVPIIGERAFFYPVGLLIALRQGHSWCFVSLWRRGGSGRPEAPLGPS